jgi:alkylation response protein AidB-like acyl-CoA dehydrogenase
LDFRDSADEAAFRERLREWLSVHAREFPTSGDEYWAKAADWHRALYEGGFFGLSWPREFGGQELAPVYDVILDEELTRAGAPARPSLGYLVTGLGRHGSTELQQRFLPGMINGTERWCQGFSEPGAGSDLASLTTTAVRDGDNYVIHGHKIWTSYSDDADWCLLLARTDPDASKRKGISYFLLDMTTPGVEVRPIRNAVGDSHFCEIFFNDARVPATNLVGAENSGWQVAQATLGAERGMTMLELAERLGNAGFRWLVQTCPTEDPVVADRLAQFETEITGLRGLCRQLVENTEAGTAGIADASVVKLYYSELLQRMTDFGAEIGGLAAHTDVVKSASSGWESGSWVLDFIGSWEWTIPGGSSEIQRTIIAERGLGLPREPSVA